MLRMEVKVRVLDDKDITVRAANLLIKKGINDFEGLSNITQGEIMKRSFQD